MAAGPVSGIVQDQSLVTRAPKLKKEMGDLDWSMPAAKLARVVRAMQPWPTAFTHWVRQADGKPPLRLLVTKVKALPSESHQSNPGELLPPPANFSCMRIATGEGVLEIHSLQPAGKAAMDARSFLMGRRYMPGDRLEKGVTAS